MPWIISISVLVVILAVLTAITIWSTSLIIKKCFSRVDFDFNDSERVARSGIIMDFFKDKEYKEMKFRSFDDTLLVGYYVYNKKPTNNVVIVHHGYHSDHMSMTPYAQMYYDMGYDVLLIDSRNCGKSEGKYTTFGVLEAYDIEKWIDQIIFMKGKDARVILSGVSMGAVTSILAATTQSSKYLTAVIADCPYTTFNTQIENVLKEGILKKEFTKKFSKLIITLMRIGVKVYCKFDTAKSSPLNAVQKTSVPILFIHGSEDKLVDVKMASELYEKCVSKKALFIMDGASHAQAINYDRIKYQEVVSDFLWEIKKESK